MFCKRHKLNFVANYSVGIAAFLKKKKTQFAIDKSMTSITNDFHLKTNSTKSLTRFDRIREYFFHIERALDSVAFDCCRGAFNALKLTGTAAEWIICAPRKNWGNPVKMGTWRRRIPDEAVRVSRGIRIRAERGSRYTAIARDSGMKIKRKGEKKSIRASRKAVQSFLWQPRTQ